MIHRATHWWEDKIKVRLSLVEEKYISCKILANKSYLAKSCNTCINLQEFYKDCILARSVFLDESFKILEKNVFCSSRVDKVIVWATKNFAKIWSGRWSKRSQNTVQSSMLVLKTRFYNHTLIANSFLFIVDFVKNNKSLLW